MQLSPAERLIVRNQLQIMKALKVSGLSAQEYDEQIEIVESGYTRFYDDVLSGLREKELSTSISDEVFEILDLFRSLDNAKTAGLKVSGGTGHASFAGFDANNDPHYGFARFVLDAKGLYTESAPAKNSHSSITLSTYRRMVSVWQSLGRNSTLSQSEVDAILA